MTFSMNESGNHVLEFTSNVNREQWGHNTSLGTFTSTMELFLDTDNKVNGSGLIEWDIPELETTESIGVWWADGELTDYDGVFELPEQAVELLRHYGIKVSEDFLD